MNSLPSSGLTMTDLPVESISEPLPISEKLPILEPLSIEPLSSMPLPTEQVSEFVKNLSNSAGVSAVPIVEGVNFFQNFDHDRNFDLDPDDGHFDFLVDTSGYAQETDCILLPDHTSVDTLVDPLKTRVDPSSTSVDRSSIVFVDPNLRGEEKSYYFFPLDAALFEKVCSMDKSKSVKNEKWATSLFNSWEALVGLSVELFIVELPLQEFVDLLTKFFLCHSKDNGERYPLDSIGNMYDSFHRIIARHQSKVMKEKSIKEPLVPISSHQFFFQTNVAIEKAMELSCNAGVNNLTSQE